MAVATCKIVSSLFLALVLGPLASARSVPSTASRTSFKRHWASSSSFPLSLVAAPCYQRHAPLAKDGRTQNLRLKKKITRNSDILALASRKPGSSPVGGGVLNPAYWKLEYLKAEMYKMVPPRMKVLLLGSGAGRDAFYFPKEVQVTMEGLTVNIQDVIQGGGNALPALQIANSIKSLAADSFDVVVTAGEFSRVTNNGKMNSDQWFQSVCRVLRPNGRILFIEPAEAEFPRRFLQTFPAASVNSDQEALLGPLGSKFDYGEAVVFEDEFLELEPGAGFGKAATSPKDRDKKRRKR